MVRHGRSRNRQLPHRPSQVGTRRGGPGGVLDKGVGVGGAVCPRTRLTYRLKFPALEDEKKKWPQPIRVAAPCFATPCLAYSGVSLAAFVNLRLARRNVGLSLHFVLNGKRRGRRVGDLQIVAGLRCPAGDPAPVPVIAPTRWASQRGLSRKSAGASSSRSPFWAKVCMIRGSRGSILCQTSEFCCWSRAIRTNIRLSG
jgi:hypothetical protein